MKLKKFFKKLKQFNNGVVNDNDQALAIKYFMNPTTLDYDIVRVEQGEEFAVIDFLDKEKLIYQSDVIHFDIMNKKDRKMIVKDMVKNLEAIEFIVEKL
jgi:hypothetical protein